MPFSSMELNLFYTQATHLCYLTNSGWENIGIIEIHVWMFTINYSLRIHSYQKFKIQLFVWFFQMKSYSLWAWKANNMIGCYSVWITLISLVAYQIQRISINFETRLCSCHFWSLGYQNKVDIQRTPRKVDFQESIWAISEKSSLALVFFIYEK